MEYASADLSPRERYKVLTSFVLPRPIAWVTSVGQTGVVNAAPFSFFNVFCEDPRLCMFAGSRILGRRSVVMATPSCNSASISKISRYASIRRLLFAVAFWASIPCSSAVKVCGAIPLADFWEPFRVKPFDFLLGWQFCPGRQQNR